MENFKAKLLIVISLFLLITTVSTCEFSKLGNINANTTALDTTALHNLRVETQKEQRAYKQKIASLKSERDSLQTEVTIKKFSLTFYRFRATSLEMKLKDVVRNVQQSDTANVHADTLSVVVEQYIETQQQKDSLCDQTIQGLEQIVCNQDSTIAAHENIQRSMLEFQKEQAANNQALWDHLNQSHKDLKRKKRQVVLLRIGTGILTGITGGLLLKQAMK